MKGGTEPSARRAVTMVSNSVRAMSYVFQYTPQEALRMRQWNSRSFVQLWFLHSSRAASTSSLSTR